MTAGFQFWRDEIRGSRQAASTNEILLIDPDYGFVGPIPYSENRSHGGRLSRFYDTRNVNGFGKPFLYLLAPSEDGYGP